MRDKLLGVVAAALGLLLVALPLSQGFAGEAEKKEPAAAKEKKAATPKETKEVPAAPEKPVEAEKPAGLVGTIVAVVAESRTLVVDVPLGKDVLRIGAEVTKTTRVEAAGAAASFESLKPGARVRIQFRRVATGDEATLVEILRGPKR